MLKSLGVTAVLDAPGGIKEEEIFVTWDLEKEKTDEAFWARVMERLNSTSYPAPIAPSEVLVVGDELVSFVFSPCRPLGALGAYPTCSSSVITAPLES